MFRGNVTDTNHLEVGGTTEDDDKESLQSPSERSCHRRLVRWLSTLAQNITDNYIFTHCQIISISA